MDSSKARFEDAAALYRAGRLEDALAAFEALLAERPGWAEAMRFRGLALCHLQRFEPGLADLREIVRLQPRNAAFHASLGMILFVLDRLDEAEPVLRRSLELDPAQPDALNNLGLLLRARGDFAGAERAARQALSRRAEFPQARLNLGYALLAQGRLAEAWPHHAYRPHAQVNLRDAHLPVTVPHAAALPPPDAPIIVHGEQGLGDAIFFLRYAPRLRERGHRLAFWGDARLHPVLARSGLFEHFLRPEASPGAGIAVAWAGDLPGWLDAPEVPPPLPLAVSAAERAALRERFARAGPGPYIGLTWRAGLPRGGKVVLSKSLPLEALAAALRGVRATFVALQRGPQAQELRLLADALGAPLLDESAANDDLDRALVTLAALDDYVAVSNTNVHLRASAGGGCRVLVPWPPEWRWPGEARSPWFPGCEVYRQPRAGDWEAALARLAADLRA